MKIYNIGNTVIKVHSPIVHMTDEERKKHFEEQIAKKNPVYMEIIEAMHDCYKKYD